MKPLIVLLAVFLLALVALKVIKGTYEYSLAGRIAMSSMLLFASVGHFMFTEGMSAMIPDFIPAKKQVVILTGLFEILLAIGLLLPNYKTITGWIIIVFFILILPANIKASMENINYETGELDGKGLDYLWIRVPLQLFYILWTYMAAIRN